MIKFENVSYSYKNTTQKTDAVKNVSFTVNKGDFLGIIGHTGSGKSTLTELMSGLLKPDDGEIYVDGTLVNVCKNAVRELKGKVGMVFQYPEHQLFEETVIKDICFGPKNLALSQEECLLRAREAMTLVGLDSSYEELSPFELSGGEKRRVAIAGVIAMHPKVLVLDEPTAGLDPAGREALMKVLKNIKGNIIESIVLVSHSMEDVAAFCNKVLVMNNGERVKFGTVRDVFADSDYLLSIGLDIPQITRLISRLNDAGYGFDKNILTVDEAFGAIYNRIRGIEDVEGR